MEDKKIFQGYDKQKPDFLSKNDEVVNSRGRRSFDDVRKKLMRTDKQRFIWAPKFDDKKLDWEVDKDPLKKSFSFFSIGLFVFSLVLLFSAVAFSYYSFTSGGYTVRADKIDLSLDIPTFTSAGQDMNGQIIISNNNRTIFKEAYVVLDLVEKEGEPGRTLNQVTVGDVESGNKIYKNISLNLTGLEGEEKQIDATLFYKVPQSDSVFEKKITQKVLITKSPVTMSITGPNSLSVLQDGEYTVTIRGVSKVIPALLLTLDVPKQMRIIKTNIPKISKNTYSLGPINEGDNKTFKFTGSFMDSEEIGDRFSIKVSAGSGDEDEIKGYFSQNTYSISLSSNPVKMEVLSDGQSGEKISFTSQQPKATARITNNSNVRVTDGEISIKFSGGLLVPKSVTVQGANYDSNTFTATANGTTNTNLKIIEPGKYVDFPIVFNELTREKSVLGRNLYINTSFTYNTDGSEGKPITQRIATNLTPQEGTTVSLKTLYFSGAFKNTGAMPPKVGSQTTYTINLDVDTNSGFTNGKFTVPLPAYVTFIKSIDNTVTYNKETRTVVWNVGNLSKATTSAFGVARRDTSIQVSISPSPAQANSSPLLTASPVFDAVLPDKTNLNITADDATTNISTDPKYILNANYDSVAE